jgi:uncharacterized protein (UPF0276 family)
MTALAAPAKVGVGMPYLPARPELVTALLSTVDYVEMRPESFATETHAGRTIFDAPAARAALGATLGRPVVLHGAELSIGAAHGWHEHIIDLLDGFLALQDVPWHSQRLGFSSAVASDGSIVHLGLPMPLPFTAECATLVARRAEALMARFGRPFLLENSANHLPDLPADPGWDEATFLTALTERSGCWLLLDLSSLWINCVNHRLDQADLLGRMPLHRVAEVRVGAEVPGPVWRMLEHVLSLAPHVAGVTVDVPDRLGERDIRAQLDQARDLWDAHLDRRRHPARKEAA